MPGVRHPVRSNVRTLFLAVLTAILWELGADNVRAQVIPPHVSNYSFHWKVTALTVTLTPIVDGGLEQFGFNDAVAYEVAPAKGSVSFGPPTNGYLRTLLYQSATNTLGLDTFTLNTYNQLGEERQEEINLTMTNTLPVAAAITTNLAANETSVPVDPLGGSLRCGWRYRITPFVFRSTHRIRFPDCKPIERRRRHFFARPRCSGHRLQHDFFLHPL